MSMRSVHSRRSVPTQRSAKAFARGACGGAHEQVPCLLRHPGAGRVGGHYANSVDDHVIGWAEQEIGVRLEVVNHRKGYLSTRKSRT
jgi:hypothetical protein